MRPINFLEIELTTNCDLKCIDCDRQCRQAPSLEYMTVEQIAYFLSELDSTGYNFELITLLGGEPLLHPDLFEILYLFSEFGIRPAFNTNGYSDTTRAKMRELKKMGYEVKDTKKTSIYQDNFDRMNIAPVDFNMKAYPCWIPSSCGYGLSRYGFYPCGAGAAIDRVMGFDIGIKSLANLSDTHKLYDQLCKYCGHSKIAQEIPSHIKISPTWVSALKQYRTKPPKLTLYGREYYNG